MTDTTGHHLLSNTQTNDMQWEMNPRVLMLGKDQYSVTTEETNSVVVQQPVHADSYSDDDVKR